MNKRKNTVPSKDPNVYPPGWNYKTATEIAHYYDGKKEEIVLDDQAKQTEVGLVWMEVPQELVAEIQKLITRRRKIA